jgi:hypothetical protein
MTIAGQVVGEGPAGARTRASRAAGAAWKAGMPAPPDVAWPGGILSVPATGRLPGGGGGMQGGLNDCRQRGGAGVGGYHHGDRPREDAEEDLKAG